MAGQLDATFIRGTVWSGLGRSTLQLLTFASTIIVARLLDPSDYGVFGMAVVCVGLAQMAGDLGVPSAIVQYRHLTQDQIASLAGLVIMLTAALAGLCAVLAVPVAGFYGVAEVGGVLSVYSIAIVLAGLRAVPVALMTRDFAFRPLAYLTLLEGAVISAVTLAFAVYGWRYWAFVAGGLAGSSITAFLAFAWRPYSVAWPWAAPGLREVLRYGYHLAVSRLASFGWGSSDSVIIGRILGKESLGLYTLAVVIAGVPVERVASVIGQVAPAVFSAVRVDLAETRRYFLRVQEVASLVIFPMAAGLALVAEPLVLALLGARWEGAVVPLRILSAYGGVKALATLANHVTLASGRSRVYMSLSVISLVTFPPVLYIGTGFGVVGVAGAWVVAHLFCGAIPALWIAMKQCRASWRELASALRPAAEGSAMMVIVVLVLRRALALEPANLAMLATEIVVGATCYTGTILGLHRNRVIDMVRGIIRGLRAETPRF